MSRPPGTVTQKTFPRPTERPTWRTHAACRDVGDPDLMFPNPLDTTGLRAALAVCAACPVRPECATYAIDTGQRDGVWGGLSTEHLRAAARHRPRPIPNPTVLPPPPPDPRAAVATVRQKAAVDSAFLHTYWT